ncbi:hypothetical protein QBC37DRAFT_49618 [Rhypophila decipiens]|uniref:Uncharacterized protein n=1 Tax=Rhypophila decipiens TaxID=261697 RepID=A0AAN6XZ51_9PEZI|nr:hypothetical protein QBC37DRAFT_49618 [Rhypophila decipiens]
MGDVDQGLGLALAIIGIALGFFGYYIDIGEFVRSYLHAELHLWATITKFQSAKLALTSSTRTPAGGSIGVNRLSKMGADIESALATILRDPSESSSTNNELQIHHDNRDTGTPDLEAQLPPMPCFSSHAVKLKWSLGRKRVLEAMVDVFCGQVDMYKQLLLANLSMPAPMPDMSTADQSAIWLTDFRGTVRRFNIELCKGVGNFVLCLLVALKSSQESLDLLTLAALLNGEFWVIAEDHHDHDELESSSDRCVIQPGVDRRHGAILADTWEANVRPGRRFKMVMPTGDASPNLDKETLHGPWESIIRPILPNILQILGWHGDGRIQLP